MRSTLRTLCIGSLAIIALAGSVLPGAAAAPAGVALDFAFAGQTDPAQNHVHVVGPDDVERYGTVRLTGTTEIAGSEVAAEVIGFSLYRDGVGPFVGALTLTFPSGDAIGLRYDAVAQPDAEGTTVAGALTVIGGSGAFVEVTGQGVVTARRSGELGSAVEYAVTLTLAGLPEGFAAAADAPAAVLARALPVR
ncbi:MAG: hypothetical protein ACKOTZ_02490 [Chloroflexota bacterium]